MAGTLTVEPKLRADQVASDAALRKAAAEPAVTVMPHIAQLTAAPTAADFNGLLTALTTAGLMAAS